MLRRIGLWTVLLAHLGACGEDAVVGPPPRALTVTLAPASARVALGATQRFTALASRSDSTLEDATARATWTSSAPEVLAKGEAPGTFTALKTGEATVTAKIDDASGEATVTVVVGFPRLLALDLGGATLVAGTAGRARAVATYPDDTTADVSEQAGWASTDPLVLSVSNVAGERGLLRGVAEGRSTLSARFEGDGGAVVEASVEVPVGAATPVRLEAEGLALAAGRTGQARAFASYTDGSRREVTGDCAWSSADEAKATVSDAAGSRGVVVARTAGTAGLVARLGELVATASVTVTPAELVSVEIVPLPAPLAVGTSGSLGARATLTDGSTADVAESALWRSTLPDIVAVSNEPGLRGRVRALALGESEIRLAVAGPGGVELSDALVVATAAARPSVLEVAPATVAAGLKAQLVAYLTLTDGSRRVVSSDATWSSAAPDVAVVSNDTGRWGEVTGKAPGLAVISARVGDLAADATVTVTDARLFSLELTPATSSVPAGRSVALAARGIFSDGRAEDVTRQVNFSSPDAGLQVATAAGDEGRVTPLRAGVYLVQAERDGVRASARVTGLDPVVDTLVALRPDGASLEVLETKQLALVARLSDGGERDITDDPLVDWSVDDGDVLGLGGRRGTVVGRSAGRATVTATLGASTVSLEVTVVAAAASRVVAITTTPPEVALTVGDCVKVEAKVTFADGTVRDGAGIVTFTSADPSLVLANAGELGRYCAQGAGTTTLEASAGGVTASVPAVVSPREAAPAARIVSISIVPTAGSVAEGAELSVQAQCTWSNGWVMDCLPPNWGLEWTSDAPGVAAAGPLCGGWACVRGLYPGTAKVRASRDGVTSNESVVTVTSRSGPLTVTGFWPPVVDPGEGVSVVGTGFATTVLGGQPSCEENEVLGPGNQPFPIVGCTATSLSVTVPADATSGPLAVKVRGGAPVSTSTVTPTPELTVRSPLPDDPYPLSWAPVAPGKPVDGRLTDGAITGNFGTGWYMAYTEPDLFYSWVNPVTFTLDLGSTRPVGRVSFLSPDATGCEDPNHGRWPATGVLSISTGDAGGPWEQVGSNAWENTPGRCQTFGLTVKSAAGKTARYLKLVLTPGRPSNWGIALYELAFSEH